MIYYDNQSLVFEGLKPQMPGFFYLQGFAISQKQHIFTRKNL